MGAKDSTQGTPSNGEPLPKPDAPFNGKIGRTVKDSKPDFPKGVEAPAGAPNILLILTDDVGFGATSVFGGPIQTPNFQRVADRGLRYNCWHTTASMLAAQGASLLEIADVLGHKTLAMVKRYSHLVVDHKAKVIENMVAAKGL